MQLNLQQSFGGGLDTLVKGIQQILLRYLNANLVILCTCTANPIWPLGNQAGDTSYKATISSGILQHSPDDAPKFSVFYESPPLS